MRDTYHVGVTADGFLPDGSSRFGDLGLDRLTAAGLTWEYLPSVEHQLTPDVLAPYDAVLSLGHLGLTRDAAAAAPRLRHLARYGAGYDGIDVPGVAAEGVVVTNTPTAVRRPLALAALTLLLALAHRLPENHQAAAEGRWGDRGLYRGPGVAGRTVGIVGLGGVGCELAELVRPLGVRVLAADPGADTARAESVGAQLVPLDRLAAESDYVVLTAALTPSSYHLVDAGLLAAMRPTSYLVNVGRGGLVDHDALRSALLAGRIAGAGLDVLEPEPPAPDDPLLTHPDVIVTPHALCWTQDFTDAVATSAVEAIIDVAQGRRPAHALDPSALHHERHAG
ncbi:NAD(P)-dependent oxidoreductase [Cellulomonas xiejunii]|uniref:NAD(P)-dependent oxidoreductase n=1 Tax=Cellulomonas xiejunii TaxID=2968083 RepID=UPI001D0E85BE|nr:NAD(P)-dependent oxidoreductase [Cellulomonas xiejunii]MCC2315797.1 dehydrogenase [Cellulomonas xiejunii]